MQPGYDHYPSVSSGLEISSKLASGVLSLPMHPYLDESKVQKISSLIIQYTNVTKCL
jgi:dTDP-4-amino-4,6-dideoxygalactose transaminase